MAVHLSEKLIQDSELINQLVLDGISNEKAGIYVFPILSNKAEIAAALFGLKYTFEQLSLHRSNAIEKENAKLFFWVRQPKDCEDSFFNQNILKICDYYQIVSKCSVRVQDDEATIELYLNDESSKTTVEVKEAAEWILSSFFEKFKSESLETLVVTYANESSAVAEPQTNMGRMARKLKADQLVKELDLTKSIYPNKAT